MPGFSRLTDGNKPGVESERVDAGTVRETTTDDVLSDSVERVRSSRELLEQINERLARGQRLLNDGKGPSA